jgi:FkbM family methyltransferase
VSRLIYPPRLGRQDDFEFQIRSQTGSRFTSRTSDALGHGFSLVGYNEWRLWAAAIALTSPGDTIVEVGANIGTETIGFSDIVGAEGRVVAFEPVPSSVAALEKNLSHSRYGNVEVLPYAVGDRAAVERLSVPSGFPSQAQIVTDHGADSATIEVESVTLDSMEDVLGDPRMLFVDVEGSEVNVIRGGASMIARSRPHIFIEANPKALNTLGFTAGELKSELIRFGYTIAKVERFGLSAVAETEFRGYQNWICVQQPRQLQPLQRFLRMCALLPCVPFVHPLTRPRVVGTHLDSTVTTRPPEETPPNGV